MVLLLSWVTRFLPERPLQRKVCWIMWYHLPTNFCCLKIICYGDLSACNTSKSIVLQQVWWKMQLCFTIYTEVNFVLSIDMPGVWSRFELLEAVRKAVLKQQIVLKLALEPFPSSVHFTLSSKSVRVFWQKRMHSWGRKVISLQVIFIAFFCQLSNNRPWEGYQLVETEACTVSRCQSGLWNYRGSVLSHKWLFFP